jgi:two-component system, OmpR family, sensor kinase
MRLTIRTRLSLQFGLVVAMVIISLGAYLYFEVRTEILSAVDQGLQARAAQIEGTITRSTGGIISPNSLYFHRDQSFVQVISGSLHLVESSSNVSGKPMLPIDTISSVSNDAYFTRTGIAGVQGPVRILVTRYPQPGPDGFLLVGQNLAATRESLSRIFLHYLVACAVAVAFVLVITWLSIRSTLRPVERIRREAKAISSGDPSNLLYVPDRDDELSRLSQTLNEMLERVRSAAEHERRFIMFASHELRTPLTVLRTELDLALSQPRTADELRSAIISAGEETDRLAQLSNSLITLAAIERHDPPAQPTLQNVSALIDDVCRSLTERARALDVHLDVRCDDLWAPCDPIQIRQAISNLVDNALRYSPSGATVSVAARRRADAVQITVEDAGPGFPESFLSRAFEPFARAGGSEGTGLGLAIVWAVAQTHGGRASAINLSSGGARVAFEFPDLPGTERRGASTVAMSDDDDDNSPLVVTQSPEQATTGSDIQ